jgi:hypothetical protein
MVNAIVKVHDHSRDQAIKKLYTVLDASEEPDLVQALLNKFFGAPLVIFQAPHSAFPRKGDGKMAVQLNLVCEQTSNP